MQPHAVLAILEPVEAGGETIFSKLFNRHPLLAPDTVGTP